MARRPCRRREPSSSDADDVSAFDKLRQGDVTTVDKDTELAAPLPGNRRISWKVQALSLYCDPVLSLPSWLNG